MPYATQERRADLDDLILDLAEAVETPEELGYVMLKLGAANAAALDDDFNAIALIDSAFSLAQHEYRQLFVDPYQAKSLAENGGPFDE